MLAVCWMSCDYSYCDVTLSVSSLRLIIANFYSLEVPRSQ